MKYTEIEIDRLLQPPNYLKLPNPYKKNPGWVLSDKTEGVELQSDGTLKGFAFWENERDYKKPLRDETLLNLLKLAPETLSNLEKTGTVEKGMWQEQLNFPMAITPEVYKIDQYKRLIAVMSTDKQYIRTKKGRSGRDEQYVTISYVIHCLNFVSGFEWSVTVDKIEERSNEIIADVTLSIKINGQWINKSHTGNNIINKKQDGTTISIGDDRKSAISDAIKKAASLLGVAADVYGGDNV